MKEPRRYTSYSFNPFTVWKMTFLILLFPSFLIFIFQLSAWIILVFLALLLGAIIFYIINSYSEIVVNGNSIQAMDHDKTLVIDNIDKVSTWWAYDFGRGSVEMDAHGASGKSRPLINKINVYARIENNLDEIVLFETIYLGNKFPNNHAYLIDVSVDSASLIQVRDIDKCLEKLGLEID